MCNVQKPYSVVLFVVRCVITCTQKVCKIFIRPTLNIGGSIKYSTSFFIGITNKRNNIVIYITVQHNKLLIIRKLVRKYSYTPVMLKMNIIPNLKKIKIRNAFPGFKYTQQNIQPLCNKDELKFLYIKKWILKEDLQYINRKAANEWNKMWQFIGNNINMNINIKTDKSHKTISIWILT